MSLKDSEEQNKALFYFCILTQTNNQRTRIKTGTEKQEALRLLFTIIQEQK